MYIPWPDVATMTRQQRNAELDYWERRYSGQFAPLRVIARMDALMTEPYND